MAELMAQPLLVITLLACLVATLTDLYNMRIPNALTLSMWFVGLVGNASLGNWQIGVYGFASAFAIHFTLWKLGVQKGGDAKLLIGIGALMGPGFMLATSMWYAIFYLPISGFVLWRRGRLSNLGKAAHHVAATATHGVEARAPEATMMVTGPIIAAATVMACLW